MKSSVQGKFFFLQIFFLFLFYTNCELFNGNIEHKNNSLLSTIQKNSVLDHESKLLHLCSNSDYRTYIKCLKREKRDFNSDSNSCLDECMQKQCETSLCLRNCHRNCKLSITETHSTTYQKHYACEDCEDNNKNQSFVNVINITNVIPRMHGENQSDASVQNIINNNLSQNCVTCPTCCNNQSQTPNQNPFQITLQITSGQIGGGCIYGGFWPCISKTLPNPPPIICTGCSSTPPSPNNCHSSCKNYP